MIEAHHSLHHHRRAPSAIHGPATAGGEAWAGCTNHNVRQTIEASGPYIRYPDGTTATIVCRGEAFWIVSGGPGPSNPTYATSEGKHGDRNDDGF